MRSIGVAVPRAHTIVCDSGRVMPGSVRVMLDAVCVVAMADVLALRAAAEGVAHCRLRCWPHGLARVLSPPPGHGEVCGLGCAEVCGFAHISGAVCGRGWWCVCARACAREHARTQVGTRIPPMLQQVCRARKCAGLRVGCESGGSCPLFRGQRMPAPHVGDAR